MAFHRCGWHRNCQIRILLSYLERWTSVRFTWKGSWIQKSIYEERPSLIIKIICNGLGSLRFMRVAGKQEQCWEFLSVRIMKYLLKKVRKSYLKFSLFFSDVSKSKRLWRMCLTVTNCCYKLTERMVWALTEKLKVERVSNN